MLGVDKGASADDIKKAFRKKALVDHPDKGGNKETFQKLQEAYSILSDPAKKSQYDQTGQIPGEGGGPVDLSEIFGSMFGSNPFGQMFGMGGMGGMGGMPGMQGQRNRTMQGPNKLHDIGVPLAELYHGKKIVLKFKRDILCAGCSGKGGIVQQCMGCGGRGIVMQQQQMGPMMIMSQRPCPSCQQTGTVVTDACSLCKGKKVSEAETTLEAHIKPGTKGGDRIVFPEKCSESPNYEKPGDVILVVHEVADPVFQRSDSALTCDIQLSLAESLLGFERSLKHPSGKMVDIKSDIVRHTDVLTIEGQGMPHVDGSGFGPLLVRCLVTPTTLTEGQKYALRGVFTPEPLSLD